MLVRARCAPHFKRLAYEKDPNSPITKATGYMGGGCLAGTNYARVTPNGELTPCPYMPLSAGNIRENSFVDLWEKSDVFNSFRYPQLKGKCGDCEYYGHLRRLPRPSVCGSWRLAGRRSMVPLYARRAARRSRSRSMSRKRPCGSGMTRLVTVEPYSLLSPRHGEERRGETRAGKRHPDRYDRAYGRTPEETLRQRRTGI